MPFHSLFMLFACFYFLFSCSLHAFLSSTFNNMLAAATHNIKGANKTMYT